MGQEVVTLHSKIKARYEMILIDGSSKTVRIETTPGRMMLADLLPKHPNVQYDMVNKLLTKKDISAIIDVVYRHCGQKETVIFADRIMALGFGYACKAGISFG